MHNRSLAKSHGTVLPTLPTRRTIEFHHLAAGTLEAMRIQTVKPITCLVDLCPVDRNIILFRANWSNTGTGAGTGGGGGSGGGRRRLRKSNIIQNGGAVLLNVTVDIGKVGTAFRGIENGSNASDHLL